MRGFTFVIAALLAAATTAPAGAGGGAHRDAVRDYLIVKHCGLETYAVSAGFRIQIIDLVEREAVTPKAARIDRDAAAEQVRKQWRNRGMGDGDPRCLTEAREAAERFLRVLDQQD